MFRIRADHLAWRWLPPGTMELKVYYGQGWNAVTCVPQMRKDGVWCAVYRVQTGFLVSLEHVPLSDWLRLDVAERKSRVSMAVMRATATPAGGGGGSRHRDKLLEERAPALAGYLTDDAFPDGEVRQGASLTIFYDSDGVKVLLNERDQELQLWGIADSFYSLPEALEALLTAPAVAWRRPKGWKPAAAPKADAVPLPRQRKSRK